VNPDSVDDVWKRSRPFRRPFLTSFTASEQYGPGTQLCRSPHTCCLRRAQQAKHDPFFFLVGAVRLPFAVVWHPPWLKPACTRYQYPNQTLEPNHCGLIIAFKLFALPCMYHSESMTYFFVEPSKSFRDIRDSFILSLAGPSKRCAGQHPGHSSFDLIT